MQKYRWAYPLQWLNYASKKWDKKRLQYEVVRLALHHDSDTLQEMYQSEMEDDRYFIPMKS